MLTQYLDTFIIENKQYFILLIKYMYIKSTVSQDIVNKWSQNTGTASVNIYSTLF